MPSKAASEAPCVGLIPEHATIIREPGKFQGEREAVRFAHETALNGLAETFGDTEEGGFYARVLFDGSPHLVCFVENSDGFVCEITNDEWESAWIAHVEELDDADARTGGEDGDDTDARKDAWSDFVESHGGARAVAELAGYYVREGEYRDSADNRLGRWYVGNTADSDFRPFGSGYASEAIAWERAAQIARERFAHE